MTNEQNTQWPSEADLEWLDEILLTRRDHEAELSEDQDEGILSISELHGYFSAIAGGPVVVLPSEWLPPIWGDFEPVWSNEEQAERAMDILSGFLESVIAVLILSPQDYEPLFMTGEFHGERGLVVDEWCQGYLRGMEPCLEYWPLDDEDMMDMLMPIMTFGASAMDEFRDSLSVGDTIVLQKKIAPSVLEINNYWENSEQSAMLREDDIGEPLPVYEEAYLKALGNQALIELMCHAEDRLPRNVIDECVNRGDEFIDALMQQEFFKDFPTQLDPDLWWMRLHSIMILGLMPGEQAADTLLQLIDNSEFQEDYDFQDWFCGQWPALTRNKPESFFNALTKKCENMYTVDWFTHANLTEALTARAYEQGGQAFEAHLEWVEQRVVDEEQEWDYRLSCANVLLDFPREKYRPLIEEMAARQEGSDARFNRKDVDERYAEGNELRSWTHMPDVWAFYDQEAIEQREQRRKEDMSLDRLEDPEPQPADQWESPRSWKQPETFRREAPKVGRNDPCPCGSGKKYKKCCLN